MKCKPGVENEDVNLARLENDLMAILKKKHRSLVSSSAPDLYKRAYVL